MPCPNTRKNKDVKEPTSRGRTNQVEFRIGPATITTVISYDSYHMTHIIWIHMICFMGLYLFIIDLENAREGFDAFSSGVD